VTGDDDLTAAAPLCDTVVAAGETTIRPEAPTLTGGAARALEEFARLFSPGAGGASLALEGTLGQGGMGVVRLASQPALARRVAVKTVRSEFASNDLATLGLLREAWITGGLEHPNIVPVHDLTLDDAGRPRMILKRIEGVPWGAVMHDARSVRERFGAEDALEWNIGVLMQVCSAVHFAHRRGIVHRDLKPDNVMIGEFQEVYVLDWGLAVSLDDDGSGRLPLAADVTQVAGTPAYMAPEMLGAGARRIDERTDIYLLGAILYEMLAGRPPHGAQDAKAVTHSILRSEPALPAGAPAELSALCRKAMSADPAQRLESAEAFRQALARFLHHRGSLALAQEAEARFAELTAALAESTDRDAAWRTRVYRLLGECRFGFQQALRAWPENAMAAQGIRRVSEAMAREELRQGDPKAAAALLAGIAGVEPALVAEVEKAQALRDERLGALERLARDHDRRPGQRTRIFIGVVLGTFFTVAPLVFRALGVVPSYPFLISSAVFFLFILSALTLWARESLRKTAFNRRMLLAAFLSFTGELFLHLGDLWGDVPLVCSQLHTPYIWFLVSGMIAIAIERRWWPAAVGYFVLFLVIAAWPSVFFEAIAAANFLFTANLLYIWRMPLRELRRRRVRGGR
jgi:serine/threonine-protein kinase